MVIWNGFGILVPVIGFVTLLAVANMDKAATSSVENSNFAIAIAALIAALVTFGFSKALVRRDAILAADPNTSQTSPRRDDFFFLSLRSWSFIFLAVAALYGYGAYYGLTEFFANAAAGLNTMLQWFGL